jgi:hypothetical protein
MATPELKERLDRPSDILQPDGQVPSMDLLDPSSPRGQAVERVATYLHSLGMPNDSHLKSTAQMMVGRIAGSLGEAEMKDLPQRAVEAAMRSTEEWLDDLIASLPIACLSPTTRPLVAWQLRGPLQQFPEAFLKRGALPDSFRRAIEEAATPIVPQPTPAHMKPQQLGALPRLLCSAFWHQLGGRIRSIWQKAPT